MQKVNLKELCDVISLLLQDQYKFLVLQCPVFNQMITCGTQASPFIPNWSKIPIAILQNQSGELS